MRCIEAAAAVAAQWAEPAEAAEAAVVAAGAAAHGLDLSGSARTRVVRTRARDDRSRSENAFGHVSRYPIRVLTVHADGRILTIDVASRCPFWPRTKGMATMMAPVVETVAASGTSSPPYFAFQHRRGRCHSRSGSLAIFTAIRRASSLLSNFAADLRPGSSSK